MIENDGSRLASGPVPTAHAEIDAGLRGFMLGVYGKVALGLTLSAATAYLTSHVPAVRDHLFRIQDLQGASQGVLTPLGVLLVLSPMLVLVFAGRALSAPTPRSTSLILWAIASLMGGSLGLLALSFTGAAVTQAFLAAAIAFGALSLYGYATKRDLDGVRSFLILGLFGLVGGFALNLLLRSPALQYAFTAAGVLVFGGLIAFDTQRLKLAFHQLGGDPTAIRTATNLGALSLFVSLINLFQLLLMLSGERR